MKKIASIFCALVMVLSASAQVARPHFAPTGSDPVVLEISADYAIAYNMAGVYNSSAQQELPAGVFRVDYMKNVAGQGEQIVFSTYVANNNGSTTTLNNDFTLGIDGFFTSLLNYQGEIFELPVGYLTSSFVKATTYQGTPMNVYDLTVECLVDGAGDQVFVFSIQLPTLGVNKKIYDSNPADPNAFFVFADKTFLWEETTAKFNGTFADGEYMITDDYLSDYGVLFLYGENDDQIMSLQFNVNKAAAMGAGIPVGVYPIDGTDNEGTVSASIGIYQGAPYESYCEQYVEDGGYMYLNNRWYLASGTVTVENHNGKLAVKVDAKNTLGKEVVAIFGETPTSLSELKASETNGVAKMMENGRLVIRRNGKNFSAMGAKLQ